MDRDKYDKYDKYEKGGRGGDRGGYKGDRGDDRYDRGGRDEGDEGMGGQRRFVGPGFHRKKVCRFCVENDFPLDYKNARVMQSFITEHGKIVPMRISGTCATHQRKLTVAVKRSRQLALIGYTTGWN